MFTLVNGPLMSLTEFPVVMAIFYLLVCSRLNGHFDCQIISKGEFYGRVCFICFLSVTFSKKVMGNELMFHVKNWLNYFASKFSSNISSMFTQVINLF